MAAICLLAVFAGCSGAARAMGDDPPDRQTDRVGQARHDDHVALANAVRRAERATGGEVLSAERVQSDGRDVSRVKVIDASGRVRVYMGDQQPRERPPQRSRRDDSNND